jgi:hypothetical protein
MTLAGESSAGRLAIGFPEVADGSDPINHLPRREWVRNNISTECPSCFAQKAGLIPAMSIMVA